MIEYLNENGLDTIYNEGNEEYLNKYERKMEGQSYPNDLKSQWINMSANELERLKIERHFQKETQKLKANSKKTNE